MHTSPDTRRCTSGSVLAIVVFSSAWYQVLYVSTIPCALQSDGAIDCAYQQEYYHYANTSRIPDAYYYFQNAPSCLSQSCTLQYSGDYQQRIVYDSVSKFFSGVLESFEQAGFVGCYLSTNPTSPPDNYDDGEEEGVYSGRPWTLVIVLLASAVGRLILIAVVVWRSPHRTTTIAGTGAK
jgi:hypothetical protein